MGAPEFNPDVGVVVRKSFKAGDASGTMREFQPGEEPDWKALGWREDRVAAMVRSRYLEHTGRPISRMARKQAKRLAEDRRDAKRAHAPAKTAEAKPRKKKAVAEPIGDLSPDEMEVIRQMRAKRTS